MRRTRKLMLAGTLVLLTLFTIVGTVFAGSGQTHPNFEVGLGLSSSDGWGRTRVINPGSAYRPQVKCELQNNGGVTISTKADWGSYGASQAYAWCVNSTGA